MPHCHNLAPVRYSEHSSPRLRPIRNSPRLCVHASSEPRRRELATRLNADHDQLAVPVGAAIDQLVGPVYYRALISGLPVDGIFIDAVVSSVFAPAPT